MHDCYHYQSNCVCALVVHKELKSCLISSTEYEYGFGAKDNNADPSPVKRLVLNAHDYK